MNLRKTYRYLYYRCVRLHGRPRAVALGMALGLAVGMTPTMGFQMLLGVGLAALFGQSKVAAGIGVWITNPVTAPFIYGSTYSLGAWMLDYPLLPPEGFLTTLSSLDHLTWQIFTPLWVGGLVVAIPMFFLGWWVTYQAVVGYRLRVRHRRANRLHRWVWNPHLGWHKVARHRSPPEGAVER